MCYRYDCRLCTIKCDGMSKGVYDFQSDVAYSEAKEQYFISLINQVPGFDAYKCVKDGCPDIEVLYRPTGKVFYIEIKAQRRTFMSVRRQLPESGLIPSETLALNLSDLVRYFRIGNETKGPIFILWCLENRPCIVPPGETYFFYQDIHILRGIFEKAGDTRRFRRESGKGDVVNGQHKGVVVNYHFSLHELEKLNLADLLQRGLRQ